MLTFPDGSYCSLQFDVTELIGIFSVVTKNIISEAEARDLFRMLVLHPDLIVSSSDTLHLVFIMAARPSCKHCFDDLVFPLTFHRRPVFDSTIDTFENLHQRSPFAVDAICMVASHVRDGGGQFMRFP